MSDLLSAINREIVECRRCPRLCEWRERVALEKRKSFADQEYWGRPIPNFGDPDASLLIVGLAPAAHGANRTGRMFTGDRSGDWLYRSMHKAGLANQPTSEHADDGLTLNGVLITAVAHCAPPDNKPTREEIGFCRSYLEDLLAMRQWRAILCLGSIAWDELHRALKIKPIPKFAHGLNVTGPNGTRLLSSYHPSQQNTFTGRLTEPMLDSVLLAFSLA